MPPYLVCSDLEENLSPSGTNASLQNPQPQGKDLVQMTTYKTCRGINPVQTPACKTCRCIDPVQTPAYLVCYDVEENLSPSGTNARLQNL